MPQILVGERQPHAQSLEFEKLLLEISSLFISLPVDKIDSVIEVTQCKVCENLGFDLSTLWQWSDRKNNLMTLTHLYTIPGGPDQAGDIDAAKEFPWIFAKMQAGETMVFSNKDLPEEAAIDKQSRQSYGVESTVVIPLQISGEQIDGIISFETLYREHVWDQKEVERLQLVADMFANALMRKRAETILITSEERLSLAAESAEAGLWELDYDSMTFWATDEARRMFDFRSDEIITMVSVEQSVHPDDLNHLRESISTSFQERTRLDVEYRIRTRANKKKWICSRGRPYFRDDGFPSRLLGVSIDITARKELEEQNRIHLGEIDLLKQQLEQENYYLREDLKRVQGFEHIIGQSEQFQSVLRSATQVAPTVATVLLTGETGTGKGVLAHTIHQLSYRSGRPCVTVNCAALPANLIESELFGREKGAFTGADAKQAGRFEVANRGTLFLDEIGDLPLDMQVKLLRVLQEGEFERLGSSETVRVDVRIIAATGRDLIEAVRSGRFREDLFYRLNVYPITIPPLRERRDDITPLAHHFIQKHSRRMGKKIDRVPKDVLNRMLNYSWPGNVRELEHLIERSVIVSSGRTLVVDLKYLRSLSASSDSDEKNDLAAVERSHINHVLDLTNWKIEGPGGAAETLDLHPSTLRYKLNKLGIKRPA
jgi:formate hydrogenlyase transcriptional activator